MITTPVRPDSYRLNKDEQDILQAAANTARFDKCILKAPEKESDEEKKEREEIEQSCIVSICARYSNELEHKLPNLFRKIRSLRDLRISPGLLKVEDLPQVSDPRRITCILGGMLGAVKKFDGEGNYVIAVKEEATKPGERPSFKNAREFFLHTDLSYSSQPPEFMLLHSIVNNPSDGGFSVFCDVEKVIPQLSQRALDELQKPNFLFPAAKHWKGVSVVKFPILRRDEESGAWRIRFRRDNLRTLTRTGIEAIIELVRAFEKASYETPLLPRSLVLVDNEAFLHGRTAFLGSRPSCEPREILRIYSSRNN